MTSKACPFRFKELPPRTRQVPEPRPTSSASIHPIVAPIVVSANIIACDSMEEQTIPTSTRKLSTEVSQRSASAVTMSLEPILPVLAAPATPTYSLAASQPKQSSQTITNTETLREVLVLPEQPAQPPQRYDSPEVIYAKYVAARNAWYKAQPLGSIKTNQQYRKAVGLPQRYDKQSYEWCLDYKQMSKRCITATGSRGWTKEEMMVYLDWSKAEDERVEAIVAKELRDDPSVGKRRGIKDIWRSVEKDSKKQQALHSKPSGPAGNLLL